MSDQVDAPDTTGNRAAYLSCASSSFCAIAGMSGYAFTDFNGSWSASQLLDPQPIEGLACARGPFCMATENPERYFTYSKGTWSPALTGSEGVEFDALSCTSNEFCMGGGANGYEFTYQAGTWTPHQIGANGTLILELSCATATFCAAFDDHDNSYIWANGRWSGPQHLAPSVFDVSCPAQGVCRAVGAGTAWTYSDSKWSAPLPVDPGGDLTSISCPTTSFCVAMSRDGRNSSTGAVGKPYFYDGQAWQAGAELMNTLEPSSGIGPVSCPDPSFCQALSGGEVFTYNRLPSSK